MMLFNITLVFIFSRLIFKFLIVFFNFFAIFKAKKPYSIGYNLKNHSVSFCKITKNYSTIFPLPNLKIITLCNFLQNKSQNHLKKTSFHYYFSSLRCILFNVINIINNISLILVKIFYQN